jgi:hypothetical protein
MDTEHPPNAHVVWFRGSGFGEENDEGSALISGPLMVLHLIALLEEVETRK